MIINKYKKTKCINGCEIFNDESRYLYWENKKATTDEIEIVSFLNTNIINKNSKILHVGIGNSYIATNLNGNSNIDGISISSNEIKYANSLNLKNYNIFFLNKYSHDALNILSTSKYDLIIDVNLKSFACCNGAFENLFLNYVSLLNDSGKIFTGKKGMNWSRIVKPVFSFSPIKFFYRRLKEFDGPKENFLTLRECSELAKTHKLKLLDKENSNVVFFEKK